jgi:hypothetical protein
MRQVRQVRRDASSDASISHGPWQGYLIMAFPR